MKYKIYKIKDKTYFANNSIFDSVEECRAQIISYHSTIEDEDEEILKEKSLQELINCVKWEIHDDYNRIVVGVVEPVLTDPEEEREEVFKEEAKIIHDKYVENNL